MKKTPDDDDDGIPNSCIQVTQKQVNNPLKISNEDIQKVLQVKCKRHPQKNAKYLHLVPDVENARICNMCVRQDDISSKNYQDIREVFLESSERDLLSYPVLTDSEPGEILQTVGDCMNQETIQMEKFFLELTNQIEVIMRGRQEARKLKLTQKGDIYQRSKIDWSEIIDIENLQQILLDKNNEERLVQFIRNHVSNAERNTQKIKTIYDQYLGIKDEFSMEQPNKIRSLVCALLEEIDFFKGTHPSPIQAIQQSDEELQRKQKELEDCQTQILQSQQTLQDLQLIFEEKIRILNETHSQEIISLKQENSDLKQNIIGKKQEIPDLMPEIQFIKQDNSDLKQNISDQKQDISGLKLEKQAINEQNYGLEQQFNGETVSTWSLIKQLDHSQKSSQLVNQQPIEKELQPFKPADLLPETKLILGNYQDSKKLSVTKNSDQELVFYNNDNTQKQYQGLAYLDFVLNPSTNYVIHVQLQQAKGQDKWFQFGLLPDSVKDGSTWELLKWLEYSEYGQDGHVNTLLKGKDIRTKDKSLTKRSLEMRINIKKQILRVGSLPNYESVVQIDNPNEIEPATPYRFYLYGLNKNTKIIIKKLETVSQFDDLM